MLPLISHGEYADGTDRRTDGRQTVTLRFPIDAASVIISESVQPFVAWLSLTEHFISKQNKLEISICDIYLIVSEFDYVLKL